MEGREVLEDDHDRQADAGKAQRKTDLEGQRAVSEDAVFGGNAALLSRGILPERSQRVDRDLSSKQASYGNLPSLSGLGGISASVRRRLREVHTRLQASTRAMASCSTTGTRARLFTDSNLGDEDYEESNILLSECDFASIGSMCCVSSAIESAARKGGEELVRAKLLLPSNRVLLQTKLCQTVRKLQTIKPIHALLLYIIAENNTQGRSSENMCNAILDETLKQVLHVGRKFSLAVGSRSSFACVAAATMAASDPETSLALMIADGAGLLQSIVRHASISGHVSGTIGGARRLQVILGLLLRALARDGGSIDCAVADDSAHHPALDVLTSALSLQADHGISIPLFQYTKLCIRSSPNASALLWTIVGLFARVTGYAASRLGEHFDEEDSAWFTNSGIIAGYLASMAVDTPLVSLGVSVGIVIGAQQELSGVALQPHVKRALISGSLTCAGAYVSGIEHFGERIAAKMACEAEQQRQQDQQEALSTKLEDGECDAIMSPLADPTHRMSPFDTIAGVPVQCGSAARVFWEPKSSRSRGLSEGQSSLQTDLQDIFSTAHRIMQEVLAAHVVATPFPSFELTLGNAVLVLPRLWGHERSGMGAREHCFIQLTKLPAPDVRVFFSGNATFATMNALCTKKIREARKWALILAAGAHGREKEIMGNPMWQRAMLASLSRVVNYYLGNEDADRTILCQCLFLVCNAANISDNTYCVAHAFFILEALCWNVNKLRKSKDEHTVSTHVAHLIVAAVSCVSTVSVYQTVLKEVIDQVWTYAVTIPSVHTAATASHGLVLFDKRVRQLCSGMYFAAVRQTLVLEEKRGHEAADHMIKVLHQASVDPVTCYAVGAALANGDFNAEGLAPAIALVASSLNIAAGPPDTASIVARVEHVAHAILALLLGYFVGNTPRIEEKENGLRKNRFCCMLRATCRLWQASATSPPLADAGSRKVHEQRELMERQVLVNAAVDAFGLVFAKSFSHLSWVCDSKKLQNLEQLADAIEAYVEPNASAGCSTATRGIFASSEEIQRVFAHLRPQNL